MTQEAVSRGAPALTSRGAPAPTGKAVQTGKAVPAGGPGKPGKLEIVTIATPELGDRSYVVHDGEVAVVVDPQRDTDRVEAVVADKGVRISHVLETHMHNDYVTGGLALAKAHGAVYVTSSDDPVAFERYGARDGDELQAGSMTWKVLTTPGHTFTHLSYAVFSGAGPAGVFTGGSLLYGSTGRTDLVSPASTDELTHAQYRSAHKIAASLPEGTPIYPTHGFGSFCSATQTTGDSSTVGQEQQRNPVFAHDEDTWVKDLVAGLTAYPRYYAHMGYLNLSGPLPADLSAPLPVEASELKARIDAGAWVVDLRDRKAYAKGHLAGTLGVELSKSFSTYLGWAIPWGVGVTLIGDSAAEVSRAQRELVRIGIDRPAGQFTGGLESLSAIGEIRSYDVSDWRGLAEALSSEGAGPAPSGQAAPLVLDVRHVHEWQASHVDGAVHIPFEDLQARVVEVADAAGSRDRPVWVYCQSGMRASIAASMLDREGHKVVLVDDTYEQAADAGAPIVNG
ncbi:MAG: MBL fold metallo-hydrolase [Acidimicrobiales bacterium]